jgi:hypothetical protein
LACCSLGDDLSLLQVGFRQQDGKSRPGETSAALINEAEDAL